MNKRTVATIGVIAVLVLAAAITTVKIQESLTRVTETSIVKPGQNLAPMNFVSGDKHDSPGTTNR